MLAIKELFDLPVEVEFSKNTLQGELYPQELELITHASDKRKKEFTAGRLCARKALSKLGIENFPITQGSERQPLWPEGVMGSITHAKGCALAVVAKKTHPKQSIGVDIELADRLASKLWEKVFTPKERDWLTVKEHDRDKFATVIFSIKEAFYKAQYPLTGQYLGFLDAEVELDEEKSSFTINGFGGRYIFHDIYVISGLGIDAKNGI